MSRAHRPRYGQHRDRMPILVVRIGLGRVHGPSLRLVSMVTRRSMRLADVDRVHVGDAASVGAPPRGALIRTRIDQADESGFRSPGVG